MRLSWHIVVAGVLLVACGQQAPIRPAEAAAVQRAPLPAAPEVRFVPGEVLLRLEEGVSLAAFSAHTGVALQEVRTLSGGEVLARLDGLGEATSQPDARARTETAIAVLQARGRGRAISVQPNYLYEAQRTPDDPLYPLQWHYAAVNLPAAWDVTTGGDGPVVAIIDSGRTDHPDLVARWVGGYDFITPLENAADGDGRDADPTDPGDRGDCGRGFMPSTFHGTLVAGILGATTDNGLGVAGVNWSARLVPVRAVGRCGGTSADVVEALRWAVGLPVSGVPANPFPARVLNVSLASYLGPGRTCSSADPAMQAAVRDLVSRGATVVVAAGNANDDASSYSPASCMGTLTVAATDAGNRRARYSDFGHAVDLAAPGGDLAGDVDQDGHVDGILSTARLDDGAYVYRYVEGTSFAAPHVAGIVSLLYALRPDLTQPEVLAALRASAIPLSPAACPEGCGAGLVDAKRALEQVQAPR